VTARPNRFTIDIHSPISAEADSTDRSSWVSLKSAGGCELTIFTKSAEHAARIASAINGEPTPLPADLLTHTPSDAERRAGTEAVS